MLVADDRPRPSFRIRSPANMAGVWEETSFVTERGDGGAMAYRRFGDGPPLVCLAGGPGANALYLEDLGGLDRRCELIIPDMRGTGSSTPAETPAGYGFEQLAGDVATLQAHLGFAKMTLLAHSAACTTALVYAATDPDRLASLILVAPSRVLHDQIEDDTGEILDRRRAEPWYPAAAAATARLSQGPDPDEVAALLTAVAPGSYARWGEREQAHAATMQPDSWDVSRSFWGSSVDTRELHTRLGLVDARVLVITGALDAATGVNAGIGWAASFPRGRHVNMPDSGHHPWIDEPEPFARLVGGFLSAETV